jgi:hypothetical protein
MLTDGPYGSEERQDEREPAGPAREVDKPPERERRRVQLVSPRNGQTDDRDQSEQDVEDDTRRLTSRKQGGSIGAEGTAESEDTNVQPELHGCSRDETVGDGCCGEKDARACPGERRDGGDVAEERVVCGL